MEKSVIFKFSVCLRVQVQVTSSSFHHLAVLWSSLPTSRALRLRLVSGQGRVIGLQVCTEDLRFKVEIPRFVLLKCLCCLQHYEG